MARRVLGLCAGIMALGLFVGAPNLSAQNREAGGTGAAGKGTTADQGQVIQGKIMDVDATKRDLTLSARKGKRVTGTTGATGDKTKAVGSDTAGASGSKDAGKNAAGTGTNSQGQQYTVHVPKGTKITLDGNPAHLQDLKAGMYAKVTPRHGAGAGTGASGTSAPGASEKGTGGAGQKGTSGAGGATATADGTGTRRQVTAERIEARTSKGGAGAATGTNNK